MFNRRLASRELSCMHRGFVAIAAVFIVVLSSCSDDAVEPELGGSTTTASYLDPSPAVDGPLQGDVEVTVDLEAPRVEQSRYGVLHWNAVEAVPDGLVDPLQPRLLRTPLVADGLEAQLDRFETVNVLLSDSYGYPASWPAAPYLDVEPWIETVQSVLDDPVVAATMAESPERLIFEPWNEPDAEIFWDGTPEQFTDLWLETEQIIRATYPDALIGGPSYAFYDADAISAFVDRCAAAGCQLDYLIWHAFQVDIPSLRAAIDESNELISSGTYDALGIRGLLINEYPLSTMDLLPAENLGFLDAFEAGDVYAGGRACWGGTHVLADALDPSTWTNCVADNLNGFLTPAPELVPRAVWWVYERFAAGLAGRVEASASDPDHVTVVASVDGDAATALVGHLDDIELENPDASRAPIDIAVSISSIDGVCANVTVRAIPDARNDPVAELPVLDDAVVRIADGAHHVLLADVPAHEVRVIELSTIDC